MNYRDKCQVADAKGNHCPEPAVHRVTIRQSGQLDREVGLCEKCYQNVVAGAYGPRLTVSGRWEPETKKPAEV